MKKYFFYLICFFAYFTSLSQSSQELEQKGKLLYNKGDYQNAILFFEKSVNKAKKAKNSKSLIVVYNNLGNAYSQIGKSELALRNY